MKIFTKEQIGNKTLFKFLGIVYCWKVSNKQNSRYIKQYLGGIRKARRYSYLLCCDMKQIICLCNFKIISIKEDGINRSTFLLNYLINKQPLLNIIKKKFLKYIDRKHDHIYVLNANSGEIYLFFKYVFDKFLEKNNSKSPLIITSKKYHLEIVKMLCPEIPCLYLKNYYHNIKGESYNIENFIFYKIFSHEHFLKVEQEARTSNKKAHYLTAIFETLGLNANKVVPRKMQVIAQSEHAMLEKMNKIKLNLDNFIIISPEARSCELLEDSFWVNLINNLAQQGYDIFVNIVEDCVDLSGAKYKSCSLSYSEAYALALRAKKIYSLRSGFTEFLLDTKCPMEVYYTKFRHNNITAEQIHNEYGLLSLPDINPELIKEVVYE